MLDVGLGGHCGLPGQRGLKDGNPVYDMRKIGVALEVGLPGIGAYRSVEGS